MDESATRAWSCGAGCSNRPCTGRRPPSSRARRRSAAGARLRGGRRGAGASGARWVGARVLVRRLQGRGTSDAVGRLQRVKCQHKAVAQQRLLLLTLGRPPLGHAGDACLLRLLPREPRRALGLEEALLRGTWRRTQSRLSKVRLRQPRPTGPTDGRRRHCVCGVWVGGGGGWCLLSFL